MTSFSIHLRNFGITLFEKDIISMTPVSFIFQNFILKLLQSHMMLHTDHSCVLRD